MIGLSSISNACDIIAKSLASPSSLATRLARVEAQK
jgi:hypothetical protein